MRRSPYLPIVLAISFAAGVFVINYRYNHISPATSVLVGAPFRLPAADYCAWYRAGFMIIHHERNEVYDFEAQRRYDAILWPANQDRLSYIQRYLSFFVLPNVLLPVLPLCVLPYTWSYACWYVLNASMLLAVPFFLGRPLHFSKLFLAVSIAALALFFPSQVALAQGQFTAIVLFLLTLCCRDLLLRNEARAGAWLAAACIKPNLAIPLFLALIAVRNWRAVRSFVAVGLALLLMSLAIVGRGIFLLPHAMSDYSHAADGLGGECGSCMFNARGVLSILHQPPAVSATASVLLIALAVVPFLRRRHLAAADLAYILCITMLASYHAYVHDAALIALPALLVLPGIRQPVSRIEFTAVILTGALFVSPSTVPLAFPFLTAVFAVVAYVLSANRSLPHANCFTPAEQSRVITP